MLNSIIRSTFKLSGLGQLAVLLYCVTNIGPAFGQGYLPPSFDPIRDGAGVDIISGAAGGNSPSASIGDPANGGLTITFDPQDPFGRYHSWSGVLFTDDGVELGLDGEGDREDNVYVASVDGQTFRFRITSPNTPDVFETVNSTWATLEVFAPDVPDIPGLGAPPNNMAPGNVAQSSAEQDSFITYELVSGDGTRYVFESGDIGFLVASGPERVDDNRTTETIGRLTKIVRPNNEIVNLHYGLAGRYCLNQAGGVCTEYRDLYRLITVENNLGYQLRFVYDEPEGNDYFDGRTGDNALEFAADEGFWQIAELYAINTKRVFCDPAVYTCANLAASWSPSLRLEYGSEPDGRRYLDTIDNLGRTRYLYDAQDRLRYIRFPLTCRRLNGDQDQDGIPDDCLVPIVDDNDIRYSYNNGANVFINRVASVTRADGTWIYNYERSGDIDCTTITAPSGDVTIIDTDKDKGLITAIQRPRGQDFIDADPSYAACGRNDRTVSNVDRTIYEYDDFYLKRVINPNRDWFRFVTDERGNVLEQAHFPNTVSPSSISDTQDVSSRSDVIRSTAQFHPCTDQNRKFCNQSVISVDADGIQTTVVGFYSAHGGPTQTVTDVISPASVVGSDWQAGHAGVSFDGNGQYIVGSDGDPSVIFEYEKVFAWYQRDADADVEQADEGVWVLKRSESCALYMVCNGEAAEVVQEFDYPVGSAAFGNNAQPIRSRVRAGNQAPNQVATQVTNYDFFGRPFASHIEYPDAGTPNGLFPFADFGSNTFVGYDPVTAVYDGQTRIDYDRNGRVTWEIGIDPDGGGPGRHIATRTQYNPNGQVQFVRSGTVTTPYQDTSSGYDRAGSFQEYQYLENIYDDHSRLIAEVAWGREDSDADGDVTDEAFFIKALTEYAYDNESRIECVTQRADESAFNNLITSLGNACTAQTPHPVYGSDRITRYTYDRAGRVISTSVRGSQTGRFISQSRTYGPAGVTSVEDGADNVTTYSYDGYGRLEKTTFADGSVEEVDFVVGSNRIDRMVRRDGTAMHYAYDQYGRVSAMTEDANTNTIGDTDSHYTYDALGRVLTVSQGVGQALSVTACATDDRCIGYTYDALSRVTSVKSAQGTVSYTYDFATGGRASISYPGSDNFGVEYAYALDGALTTITEVRGTAREVLASYGFDDLRRQTSRVFANGVSMQYSYDALSRTDQFDINVPSDLSWSRRLDVDYSPLGQISTISHDNAAYNLRNADLDPPQFGEFNSLNQMILRGETSPPTTSLSYDGRGNMTSDGYESYTYDHLNRVMTASSGSVSFGYDAESRLETITAQSVTTSFLYDGEDLIAEYRNGVLSERYVHGPSTDEPLVWYEHTGESTWTRRFLTADERGSIVLITDDAGTQEFHNRYDAYGIPAASNAGRFQYTGQLWIAEAEIYCFKARMYHPELGRFLQTDPAGYEAGLNLYAYVAGDPVNFADPSGMFLQAIGAAVASVATVATQAATAAASVCSIPGGGDVICVQGARQGLSWTATAAAASTAAAAAEPINLLWEQLKANIEQGRLGERCVSDAYRAQGWTVHEQITFSDPIGLLRARLDIVATQGLQVTPGQAIDFVEVKTGSYAVLSPFQALVYPGIATGAAVPRGAKAANAGFVVGEPLADTLSVTPDPSVRLLNFSDLEQACSFVAPSP